MQKTSDEDDQFIIEEESQNNNKGQLLTPIIPQEAEIQGQGYSRQQQNLYQPAPMQKKFSDFEPKLQDEPQLMDYDDQ